MPPGGRHLAHQGRLADAMAFFESGVHALGDSYLDPASTVDDAGLKLVLARAK